MKRSSKWDQKAIENELKRMPEIKDKQSKEALYERIQGKLQEDQIKPQRGKNWFSPAIATAAVFFLLLLIVPPFFNNEENLTLEESAEDDAGIMMEVNDYPSEENADTAQTEFAPNIKVTDNLLNNNYIGAVQAVDERRFREQLITIAVPVYNGTGEFVIPVTVLAEGATRLDRFMTAKEIFSGEQWGLGSFPTVQINSITEEKSGVVTIDFPNGSSLENTSSADGRLYKLAFQETFASLGYDEIQLTSDGEPGVLWGNYGTLDELDIPDVNRGYYLFESTTEHKFLGRARTVEGPEGRKEQVNFQETLELMKSGDPEKGYLASIPEEVDITNIDQTEDTVTITFKEGAIIEDKVEYLIMLEAIMFTAKDFGIQFIEFQGVELDRIGPYVSGDVIEIPKFINFIR